MTIVVYLVMCFILVTVDICMCEKDTSPKVIIDNDAGGDDAMAIFLALLYEKHYNGPKIIGLTTGNGNTNEDNVCRNNQRILQVAKRQDVPIYRGSKESMVTTPATVAYYGIDGMGDVDEVVTGLVEPKELGAIEALIELSKTHEGQLTVITLGTLTNVAMALKLDPNFINRLSQLYIAAGHVHAEDLQVLTAPEFNAHMDVEAYHVVLQHATPDKVTIFPFSQTIRYLNFSREWREDVLGAIDTDIIRAQNKYEQVALKKNVEWQALDPAAVAIALNPELVEEYKYSKNGITLCGSQRGMNTNEFVDKKDANVRVAYIVNKEKYQQFLLDIFARE